MLSQLKAIASLLLIRSVQWPRGDHLQTKLRTGCSVFLYIRVVICIYIYMLLVDCFINCILCIAI